jgi:hypothetical protein
LAVNEKAPEIYKPRVGKVNGNVAKFKENHLAYMENYAGDLLSKLGYSHLFKNVNPDVSQLMQFNSENL